MTNATLATKAYISEYSHLQPSDFNNPSEKIIDGFVFSVNDMTKHGWTYVGEATITVKFVDGDTLVTNKVDALRAEAANIRAEATAKCTKIEGQINQLLCLENNPTITEADDDSIPF